MFEQGVVSRFDVQFGEGQRPLACRADHVEFGVERDQGYGPVARVGGDAGVAGAQQRVGTVESVESRTAAAGVPLVAGELRSAAEVAASRALQQVPADRRHVAQLLGRRPPQGFRQRRIVAAYDGMVSDLGHFHSRTERQFVLTRTDLGQLGETVNVDDVRMAPRCRASSGRTGSCHQPGSSCPARRRPGHRRPRRRCRAPHRRRSAPSTPRSAGPGRPPGGWRR